MSPLRRAAPLVLAVTALALGACASRPRAAAPVESGAPAEPSWAAVIDAGSSASRIHLFRWRPAAGGGLPWIEPAGEEKAEPGLSELADRPQEVAAALAPLIEAAIERIGRPPAELSRFPLYLKATGGVRLLTEERRQAVLEAAEAYLRTTPFRFGRAEAIRGEQEGLFGWLTVNYLLGYLDDGGPFPSAGALDLGGASTQITFVPLTADPDELAAVRIGPSRFPVYTRSYLDLGQDRAREELASPACYPRGYAIPGGGEGEGDYRRCREVLRRGLAKPCAEEVCSLMGVYQPPVYGEFFAFSAYRYAAAFFDLGQDLTLARLEAAGEAYCAEEWEEIRRVRADELGNPYLPRHCFTAAYLVTLLHEGFGFPMDATPIRVPAELQGREVSWTLGALLWELAAARID